MSRKRLTLKISSSEMKELEGIINNEDSSKRLVLRCKIILLTENGIPLREIAENLGISVTAVALRILRGKELLRAHFAEKRD